ncbi:hypothetical protein PLESTF_001771400 [Pleodorina starrii]|nr:hypothetical protein PLESTM_000979000 [Pleodorina starrii]GLC76363.1 hypothetical protein PLESTF_001771400 [Pleodorina starrii]
MSDRRPKRRCVASKAQQVKPSAIHYVGYVEDDETPEMIMKKFAELERIKKAAEARRQQQQQQQQQPDACPTSSAGPLAGPQPSSADGGGPGPSLPSVASVGNLSIHQQQQQQPPDHIQADQPDGGGAAAGGSGSAGGGAAAAAAGGGDADDQMLLDEEALLEVFRQTSIFNMRGGGAAGAAARYDVAYGMEDMLFVGGDELGATPSDLEEDGELRQLREGEFWSDEDFELGGGGGGGGQRSRDRRRRGQGTGSGGGGGRQHSHSLDGESAPGAREPKQPRAAGPSGQSRHVMNQVVMQYNRDTNALIRRRVASGGSGGGGAAAAAAAGGGLVQLRVPPPPLPLSWGRTVRPYQPPEPYQPPDEPKPLLMAAAADGASAAASTSSRGFEAADLSTFPYDTALGGKQYIAVMVNAGWQPGLDAAEAFEVGREAEVMRRFRCLPLPRLVPRGFVLVWAHKGLLQAVCRCLAGWGYVYVENLTWVHLTPANAIAAQAGAHFRRSHSTLLIFRREGEGRDIELRHQRNPDVLFDCIRTLPDCSGWDLPSEVLTTIETMLPGGKGAFLELWAPRGQRRPGWDHVSEVK